MNTVHLFGACGALLVGLGLYGVIIHAEWLRKLIAMNIVGAGIFLIYGSIARHGQADGFQADPVPQALVITGIVVAFVATALSLAILVRLSSLKEDKQIQPDPNDHA